MINFIVIAGRLLAQFEVTSIRPLNMSRGL